ncbi:Flp family type IVb pilin [Arthrobacter sp. M4]|uniref:Flp family type IVb pilin n=1 Tax=Arthrobacter sp. M4 TaxID=218160 RepID=UPI001CDB4F58|nr:Flp family type IVb pilin [Arthrobacter sp. M4]MCA4135132.1 Flp family type IVb pilin [Arthrobacter sp. M4]
MKAAAALEKMSAWVKAVVGRALTAERGAVATEYGILTGLIAIVLVAGVGLFGTALSSYFNYLVTGVRTALGIP